MCVIKFTKIILKNFETGRLILNVQKQKFFFPLSSRDLNTTSQLLNRYYEELGLTTAATQNDIKTAYYKLSMMYHPDKNKGSESAAKKFRDITAAYEILGNFRLRKLYDKGIIHTAGPQYAAKTEEKEEEDDPQTKFYKAHMKKSEVPHASGRTPIYDFDEWSRLHYGASFERKQSAKLRFEVEERKKKLLISGMQNEIFLFSLAIVIVMLIIIFAQEVTYDMDVVKHKEKKES